MLWPLEPGLPGLPGNTTFLESFPGNWLFFTAVSFPSSPHKILLLMIDVIPLQEGRRERKKTHTQRSEAAGLQSLMPWGLVFPVLGSPMGSELSFLWAAIAEVGNVLSWGLQESLGETTK